MSLNQRNALAAHTARNRFDSRYRLAVAAYESGHERILEYLADALIAKDELNKATAGIVCLSDQIRLEDLDRLVSDIKAQEIDLSEDEDTQPSFRLSDGGTLALTVLDAVQRLRLNFPSQLVAAELEHAVRAFEAMPRG